MSLDDAGTDTCEVQPEATNGCAASGCTAITEIAAGDLHTCLLLADHTVMCWGMNTLGENNASIAKRTPPELVEGLTDIQVYRTGLGHTCFVRSSGPAQCFGNNYQGQLGDGTKNNTATPVAVKLEGRPKAFSLGEIHTCALLADGSVQCWGLGGSLTDPTIPQPVPGLRNVVAISSRANRTCALLEDRTVLCWGSPMVFSSPGAPPLANTGASSQRMVQNLEDVASIEAGESQACALLRSGEVKCWSYEEFVARTVLGLVEVTAIAGGAESTCALLRDKTVKCWGLNRAGELGDGITTRSADPVAVRNLADVRLLAAGGHHFCAVKQDNSVRCWGSSFELDGTDTTQSNLPVVVRFARE